MWLHLLQTTNRLIRPHGGSNIAGSCLRPAAINSGKWFGNGAYGTWGVDFEILRHDDDEIRTRLYMDDLKTAHDGRPEFLLTQHPFAHLHSRCEPYLSLTFLAFFRCGSSISDALGHTHISCFGRDLTDVRGSSTCARGNLDCSCQMQRGPAHLHPGFKEKTASWSGQ